MFTDFNSFFILLIPFTATLYYSDALHTPAQKVAVLQARLGLRKDNRAATDDPVTEGRLDRMSTSYKTLTLATVQDLTDYERLRKPRINSKDRETRRHTVNDSCRAHGSHRKQRHLEQRPTAAELERGELKV